jgi:hypothetical protein
MKPPGPPSNQPKPPHAGVLMTAIRKLAASGSITYTTHAEQRLSQRDIDRQDVLDAIRIGDIRGKVTAGRNASEWQCLIVGPLPHSARDIGIAVAVTPTSIIVIKTVEWIDP